MTKRAFRYIQSPSSTPNRETTNYVVRTTGTSSILQDAIIQRQFNLTPPTTLRVVPPPRRRDFCRPKAPPAAPFSRIAFTLLENHTPTENGLIPTLRRGDRAQRGGWCSRDCEAYLRRGFCQPKAPPATPFSRITCTLLENHIPTKNELNPALRRGDRAKRGGWCSRAPINPPEPLHYTDDTTCGHKRYHLPILHRSALLTRLLA